MSSSFVQMLSLSATVLLQTSPFPDSAIGIMGVEGDDRNALYESEEIECSLRRHDEWVIRDTVLLIEMLALWNGES